MIAKIVALSTILVVFSGCSGYQTACTSLGDLSPERNQEFSSACEIEVGDEVRINLRDGRSVEGVISRISVDEIALAPQGDSTLPQIFSGNQILSVDKHSAKAGRTFAGVLVIGSLLALVGVAVATFSIY
jgi:hypothetical protein